MSHVLIWLYLCVRVFWTFKISLMVIYAPSWKLNFKNYCKNIYFDDLVWVPPAKLDCPSKVLLSTKWGVPPVNISWAPIPPWPKSLFTTPRGLHFVKYRLVILLFQTSHKRMIAIDGESQLTKDAMTKNKSLRIWLIIQLMSPPRWCR